MQAPLKRVWLLLWIAFGPALPLWAQQDDKADYETLHLQLELQQNYQPGSDVRALLDSAETYAAQQDYVMALVFLEEARDSFRTSAAESRSPAPDTLPPQYLSASGPFRFSMLSGVDFNRQEFELGFDQSDSVLLDQVSKPYVGLAMKFEPFSRPFSIQNILRYDKENFDNELRLAGRWYGKVHTFESRLSYLFNRNFVYNNLGYNELNADFIYTFSNELWSGRLQNTSRLKAYQSPDANVPDYFRNTLNGYLSYYRGAGFSLQAYYALDYNESRNTRNNDFVNQYLGLSAHWKAGGVSLRINPQVEQNRFTYLVADSLLDNRSQTARLEATLSYRIFNPLEIRLNGSYRQKSYLKKTEQEPDYKLVNFNPEGRFYINNQFSLGAGGYWEKRRHTVSPGLDSAYVVQQDYSDRGLTLNVDYASAQGRVLSLSVRYSARRYQGGDSGANFSLYADRNIWSGLLFVQWPLFDHLSLQAVAMYDNDKDLDSAFNDSKSSFYTLELKYEF